MDKKSMKLKAMFAGIAMISSIVFVSPACARTASPSAEKNTICSQKPEAKGDTISIPTSNLKDPMKVTIVVPGNYYAEGDTTHYPTVYLLNGHGGDYRNWGRIANLDSIADRYQAIIVCPSGLNSWYWDSPEVPEMQMETFFIKDLVPYIDSNYRTRTDAKGRAITGFSMGGHGGLWLGIRHSDVFGSAGAMSGGVNIVPFPKNWNMPKMLGEYEKNPKRWEQHSVMSLVPTLKPGQVNIIFDCGTSDFFYKVNNELDAALNEAKIPHCYITSPGAHNGEYWGRAIFPQLDFFERVFNESN